VLKFGFGVEPILLYASPSFRQGLPDDYMDEELGPHMELALKKGLIGGIAVLIFLAVVFVVQRA
jgi:hypothetical protein